MNDLLRAIAGLPRIGDPLSVKVLPAGVSDSVRLTRTGALPVVEVILLSDGSDCSRQEVEGHARMLSGAPVMLDLLATVLVRWSRAVEQDEEVNGDDAVEWLTEFTTRVQDALKTVVSPASPGITP